MTKKRNLETRTWIECSSPNISTANDGDIHTSSGYHWNKKTGELVEVKPRFCRKKYSWVHDQISHIPKSRT